MTEWKTYKIGDIGKVITGKTPKTTIAENYGGAIPFLTPSDDLSSKYAPQTTKTLTERGLFEVKNCLLPSNAICVSCIGSDLGKVVKIVEPSVTNQQFNSIIPSSDFDADFVYYLMTIVGKQLNYLSKTSTAVPIINKTQFSNFEVCIPPLEEQRRIAGILSAIDDKIENNRRINDNLEQQAQALYKQWFVDNRKDDWEEIKLGDIIEISKKSITPSQSENTIFEHYSLPAFDDGIQPFLRKGKILKVQNLLSNKICFYFQSLTRELSVFGYLIFKRKMRFALRSLYHISPKMEQCLTFVILS